jgi:murein L,D-transpeptidase YafK
LDNQRVLEARLEKRFSLRREFAAKGVELKNAQVFYRIFKRERVLEVWAKDTTRADYVLIKSFPVCALAGQVGPKRVQGDGQTPEGFYFIDGFNPTSGYHLSLHIDYPNKSDIMLGGGNNLGGDIYIHGGCRTEGCMAVTDDAIKELYWISVEAYNAGQKKLPVHIFPARLTDETLNQLTAVFDAKPDYKRFWANLKPTYDYFEKHKQVPDLVIDNSGRYRIVLPPSAVANR